jgi:hypothetical protein
VHALWALWYFAADWAKEQFLVGFEKVSNISWLVLYHLDLWRCLLACGVPFSKLYPIGRSKAWEGISKADWEAT